MLGKPTGVVSGQILTGEAMHAPNTIGNFCFEVTLGYRRVERGR